jgi:hypothetical protein
MPIMICFSKTDENSTDEHFLGDNIFSPYM